ERSTSTAQMRCDASRSMRAMPTQVGYSRLGHLILPISGKPEIGAVLILRDARTSVRVCATLPARALLRMRTAELAPRCRTIFGNSHLTMSNSPSRSRGACLHPGFATSLHSPRIEGWAERRSATRTSSRRPQVASEDFKGLAFFSCGPLTPPLPSSGHTDSNLDTALDRSCALGTRFPPPS